MAFIGGPLVYRYLFGITVFVYILKDLLSKKIASE